MITSGERRRREKVGKTRRKDGRQEGRRKETNREVLAKVDMAEISNNRGGGRRMISTRAVENNIAKDS